MMRVIQISCGPTANTLARESLPLNSPAPRNRNTRSEIIRAGAGQELRRIGNRQPERDPDRVRPESATGRARMVEMTWANAHRREFELDGRR